MAHRTSRARLAWSRAPNPGRLVFDASLLWARSPTYLGTGMPGHARCLNFCRWPIRARCSAKARGHVHHAIWQWPGRVASLAENGRSGPRVYAPAAISNARKLQRSSQVLEQKSESTPKCSVEAGNNRGDPGCAHAKCRKTGGDSQAGQPRYRHAFLGTGRGGGRLRLRPRKVSKNWRGFAGGNRRYRHELRSNGSQPTPTAPHGYHDRLRESQDFRGQSTACGFSGIAWQIGRHCSSQKSQELRTGAAACLWT